MILNTNVDSGQRQSGSCTRRPDRTLQSSSIYLNTILWSERARRTTSPLAPSTISLASTPRSRSSSSRSMPMNSNHNMQTRRERQMGSRILVSDLLLPQGKHSGVQERWVRLSGLLSTCGLMTHYLCLPGSLRFLESIDGTVQGAGSNRLAYQTINKKHVHIRLFAASGVFEARLLKRVPRFLLCEAGPRY
jgi:hypothetical protein